jgi:hypothetical protein
MDAAGVQTLQFQSVRQPRVTLPAQTPCRRRSATTACLRRTFWKIFFELLSCVPKEHEVMKIRGAKTEVGSHAFWPSNRSVATFGQPGQLKMIPSFATKQGQEPLVRTGRLTGTGGLSTSLTEIKPGVESIGTWWRPRTGYS